VEDMEEEKLAIQKVISEREQTLDSRKHLYLALEKEFDIPIISFFTSFIYPVGIEDSDAAMLEGILQKCDLSKGFALMLSSPGGEGLAAERIINVCKAYSGIGEYDAIVAGKAKSAATIICFGAHKIYMGQAAELGSIDPQRIIEEDGEAKWFSVYNLVKSYEALFNRATRTKGNLQPFLQQLENYDEREIAELKSSLSLSEDMAVKILKRGMLSHCTEEEIKKKIGVFLTPETVKVHGRAISCEVAKNCDLSIETIDIKSKRWKLIYELYVRLNSYVSTKNIAKCIESKKYSFHAVPAGGKQ
jgi:ClpP class serine protease